MGVVWGTVLALLCLFGWCGQVVTAISREMAARLGVAEPESAVDPAFSADVRADRDGTRSPRCCPMYASRTAGHADRPAVLPGGAPYFEEAAGHCRVAWIDPRVGHNRPLSWNAGTSRDRRFRIDGAKHLVYLAHKDSHPICRVGTWHALDD